MRILVDAVAFQLAHSGITRIWLNLLPRISRLSNVELFMLNRGLAPSVPGIQYIDFPSYTGTGTAADSFLIDQVGTHFSVDAFTSTYYTSPVSIPSVLMVYDMIPEVKGLDLTKRMCQEKEIAISFARRFICPSAGTKTDLLKFYPEINDSLVTVTPFGVDGTGFHNNRSAEEVGATSWDLLAEKLECLLKETAAERYEPRTQRFFAEWKRLREIQAAVDTTVYPSAHFP